MGSILCAWRVAWCSALSRTARIPPWTRGWRVLPRPSSISGKPVSSETSRTASPAPGTAGPRPRGELPMSHLARREWLRTAGAGVATLALSPLAALAQGGKKSGFTLPKLPYAYDALEPHIDKRTMQIHHDKHH